MMEIYNKKNISQKLFYFIFSSYIHKKEIERLNRKKKRIDNIFRNVNHERGLK